MRQFTKQEFWQELDDAGEDVVRERLIAGVYGSANSKKELAQEWVRLQEERRSEERAELEMELKQQQVLITKSARNAAWFSAACAAIAVLVSIFALWASMQNG